ncbi:MAG TPA: PAS domain S-box protein [Chthoniobacteraceae bacterium]|nr:PAS domain S-box protein [Chthoniobacteraceae bacterium]
MRVLILEDNAIDAELMANELRRAGFELHVETADGEAAYLRGLDSNPDVILCDFRLPQMDAWRALALLHRSGKEIPFIIVSGVIGEEVAVALMREGAGDFVMKDRMGRLGQAVGQALERQELRLQQKGAEEARRQSEERFRATFEQAAVGIAHVSLEGRWLRVNQKLCDILNYQREELLKRTFLSITHPDNIEDNQALLEKFRNGQLGSSTQEKRYLRADGKWLWARVTISLVKESNGHGEYFITVVEDITERKLAEQQILEQASLIDLANDAIMVCDMEDAVRFWNQRAESLYGWGAHEVIGRKVTGLIFPVEAVEYRAARQHLLEHGFWSGEMAQVTKDKKSLTVDVRWTLLRDGHGAPKSVLALNTDVTAKKKLEEQFLRSQRLESIGTLASGVAHDLNNILAPIIMSAAMLREKLPEGLRESIITTIEESAHRGSEIVKQVLTFARGMPGDHLALQPRHLINEVEKIARETFPKSIAVCNRAGRNLSTVTGDPTQLHQVLLNLCINARDAMPGGGRLTISAENVALDEEQAARFVDAKPGEWVAITVADTGSGIPAAIIDKIFDPFFTTKEQGKGTGLGLSTVMGIVKSHGGFLTVESEVGKGAVFTIYLPASTSLEAVAPKLMQDEAPIGNGELILAVDDEFEIRTVLEALLARSGYKVITASDGNEALKIYTLNAGAIKLVLTDIMMPQADGVALARALKVMNPGVKIIASSGQQDLVRQEELQALGVKGLLRKPYQRAKLLSTVKIVLDGRETEGVNLWN